MNPTEQQNNPQPQAPQAPPGGYSESGQLPPVQQPHTVQNQAPQVGAQQTVAGSQGAVYTEPTPTGQPVGQPAQGTQRSNFMPDMNPGLVIPGDPNAPVVNPNAAKPPVNQNSTQNNLQIAEIRDGIVIMNDGSYRSVVMAKSINFDLMSPQEREGVEFGYQGFLNSLYFPVQIFIRSEKVDIRPYIEKLEKIRSEHDNMLLALLMDDYIDYIDQLASQTNIMEKHFYVVIPFFPVEESTKPLAQSKSMFDGIFSLFNNTKTHIVIDEKKLEDAKTELRNRVQAVLNGLMECNVQALPLDTQELIELYYDTYNPDTATRQQLKNFQDLQVPIITKGEGEARQPNLEKELQ